MNSEGKSEGYRRSRHPRQRHDCWQRHPLTESFRRAVVKFGIPVESALRAATANPARVLSMQDEIGSIAVGKRADLTLFDAETLEVRHCVLGGKLLF